MGLKKNQLGENKTINDYKKRKTAGREDYFYLFFMNMQLRIFKLSLSQMGTGAEDC